jgi:hypothetical protein
VLVVSADSTAAAEQSREEAVKEQEPVFLILTVVFFSLCSHPLLLLPVTQLLF